MEDRDLLQTMQELLIEAGCTINKQGMIELLNFVIGREQSLLNGQIHGINKQIERIGYELIKYSPKDTGSEEKTDE